MHAAEPMLWYEKELIAELHARALSKSTHPRKFGYHVTVRRTNVRPSVRTTGIPMFTLALSS